jgi:predicted RNA binding protein YcfA (HicA-like mRNA interferase family)
MGGIKLAKAQGVYKARVKGSHVDVQQFLSKSKNKKLLIIYEKVIN